MAKKLPNKIHVDDISSYPELANMFGVKGKKKLSKTISNDTIIILEGLPKISLNEWYSSKHWSNRKKMKDLYKRIVRNNCDITFPKDKQYEVEYFFQFRIRPLDSTNCVSMCKLVEDILFEDDNWKIVRKTTIESRKGLEDKLTMKVKIIADYPQKKVLILN